MTIKIYVASLEAYNSGRMVGDWITPTDYLSFEKFNDAIQIATKNADEVAVHDYEGIDLDDEYPDFEELYYFCQAVEDSWVDNEAIIAYAENTGEELNTELLDKPRNNYEK